MAKMNNINASSTTHKVTATVRDRRILEARITKNKYGNKAGDSHSAFLKLVQSPDGQPRGKVLNPVVVGECARVALELYKSKTVKIPIIVLTDRDWGQVRICKREFSLLPVIQQRAITSILNKGKTVGKNGKTLEWEWVGINSDKGYLALKDGRTGYGTGRNSRPDYM